MKLGTFASLLGAASIACALLAVPQTARADDGANKVETNYGVGVRLRRVFIPEWAVELFVEDMPGGGQNNGFGLELLREKGNVTIALGVEYEPLEAEDGIWIERGESIPADGVDYVEFRDLAWYGVDASFIWRTGIIGKKLSLHYGAGLGVAVFTGEVRQSDRICTNDQVESCTVPDPLGEQDKVADLPPVFPIVNVIVGLQLRPVDNVMINLEGGIRTVPFVGVTAGAMF